jgi:hypothetical protein
MDQVEGREVARFIEEAGAAKARAILVGCVLDDQKSEDGWPIVGIGEDGTLQCQRASGEATCVPLAQLPRFLVADDRPRTQLRQTLEAHLPEQERHARHLASALARRGLTPASAEDAQLLALVLEAVDRGQVPPFELQQQFYEACKRAAETQDLRARGQTLRAAARVFEKIEQLIRRLEPSIRIKLAFFLRHAGETRAAIAATEFMEDTGASLWVGDETLAILATERAAAFADLYEQKHDEKALRRADYWGRLAFAKSRGSAEASMALARIRSFGGRGA